MICRIPLVLMLALMLPGAPAVADDPIPGLDRVSPTHGAPLHSFKRAQETATAIIRERGWEDRLERVLLEPQSGGPGISRRPDGISGYRVWIYLDGDETVVLNLNASGFFQNEYRR